MFSTAVSSPQWLCNGRFRRPPGRDKPSAFLGGARVLSFDPTDLQMMLMVAWDDLKLNLAGLVPGLDAGKTTGMV
jgi:hypothetical protein